jgi:alcohol dehydrogenase class IV
MTNAFDPAAVTGNWGFPNQILVGPGRLSELAQVCSDLGITNPLVVTDPGLRELPPVHETMQTLDKAGVKSALFSDVDGNPVDSNVNAGVTAYQQGSHDGVIAIGGGSALDVGKAIALMLGQNRPIWDFEDIGDYWKRANPDVIAPVIAIPTTAGTGSEVGRASVITNTQTHRKVIIFHPLMLPKTVILDPELTVGLPAGLTAATGMDAFVHCFEAWCAPGFHPMADGIALEGMRLVAEALRKATSHGADLEARTKMLAAASMGAVAFQKGLGGVHAIAHPVGARFGTHHGLTNAVILPYMMVHNRPEIEDRIHPIARTLGLKAESFDAVLDWVLTFREQLGIPHTLSDLDVDLALADEIGALAAVDPPAMSNPRKLSAEEYTQVFSAAVTGQLKR